MLTVLALSDSWVNDIDIIPSSQSHNKSMKLKSVHVLIPINYGHTYIHSCNYLMCGEYVDLIVHLFVYSY